MRKIAAGIGLLLLVVVGWYRMSTPSRKTAPGPHRLIVVTTLFPLYDFAKTLGGDKVDVSLLLPPGVEAHSFEPKPSDLIRINESDVFIYTGRFMEPWVADILKGVEGVKRQVVDSSIGIRMIPAVFHDKDEPTGSMDPHIWLDFDKDKIIVRAIAEAFSEKDPANADFYQRRSEEYQAKLMALDEAYQKGLSHCLTPEIVYGGHYAFGYLAKRYHLRYLAAQGVSPDAEPTARDLAQLIEQVKANRIQYVFYEELTSPKIAETLAHETGTRMILLNAAHNVSKADIENDVSFLSIMQTNLAHLKTGLRCGG